MKKFTRYLCLFIFIVIATAFGTVKTNSLLNMRSENQQGNSIIDETPYEETEAEKLLNALVGMGGVDLNFQFNIIDGGEETIENVSQRYSNKNLSRTPLGTTDSEDFVETTNEIKVSFSGELSMKTLDNISIAGTLVVNKSGKDITINLSYLNNTIYVSNGTMSVKFTTDNLSKITELLPLLGVDLDLGDSMQNLDVNSLLAMSQDLKSTELENGDLLFPVTIMDGISFSLITDANYALKSVFADKIKIKDKVAVVSAEFEKNEEVEIASPEETQEFVDVTQTFNLVDNVKEILSQKKFRLNVDCDLMGTYMASVNGTINVDFANDIILYVDVDLGILGKTLPISCMYKEGNAFVNFNGKKMLIDEKNIDELISLCSSLTNDNSDKISSAIAQFIPTFDLSKFSQIDFSNIDVNNFLSFAKGEDDEIVITILGDSLGLDDITFAIQLDENGQLSNLAFDNVDIFNNTLNAKISYSSAVYLPEIDESQYVAMQDLPNFIQAVLATIPDIVSQKYLSTNFTFNVNTQNKTFSIDGLATIKFDDEIKIYLTTELNVKNRKFKIEVCLTKEEIFIQCENLKFRTTLDNVAEVIGAIASFVDDYNTYITLSSVRKTLKGIDLSKSLTQIIQDLPQKVLTYVCSREGSFEIRINRALLNSSTNMKVFLNYDEKINSVDISNLDFDGAEVSGRLELVDEQFSFDFNKEDFVSLEGVASLVRAILVTKSQYEVFGKLAVAVDGKIKIDGLDVAVQGRVLYKNGFMADLNCVVFGLPILAEEDLNIHLIYKDKTIYASVGNVKVKITLDKIKNLLGQYVDGVDLKTLTKEIMPNFDFASLLSGDLSSVQFDILKSISIANNCLTLVLDKDEISSLTDVTINLSYKDKLKSLTLGGVDIKGCQVSGTVTREDTFVAPQIVGDYVDLSNLANVIDAFTTSAKDVKENNHIGLALTTNISFALEDVNVGISILPKSKIMIDWSDLSISSGENLDISKIKLSAHLFTSITILNGEKTIEKDCEIEFNYQNGAIYVACNGLKVCVDTNRIEDIVEAVLELVDKNKVDIDLNFSQLLANFDLSNINIDMIKAFDLTDENLSLLLDLSSFGFDKIDLSNLDINIYYSQSGIDGAFVKELLIGEATIKDIDVDVTTFEEITLNENEYVDLQYSSNLIRALKKTIDNVKDSERLAIKFNKDLTFSYNIYDDQNNLSKEINATLYKDSLVQVDWANAFDEGKFDVMNLAIYLDLNANTTINVYKNGVLAQTYDNDHSINLIYRDGTIYLCYNTLKIKVKVDTIEDLVNEVFTLLEKENNFELNLGDLDLDTSFNFSSLKLNMIKDLAISAFDLNVNLDLSNFKLNNVDLDNLSVALTYDDEGLKSLNIDGLEFTKFSLGEIAFDLQNYNEISIDESAYVDLSTAPQLMKSLNKTVKQIGEQKAIAFDLKTDLVYTQVTCDNFNNPTKTTETVVTLLSGSSAKFDWTDALTFKDGLREFDVKKFKAYAKFEAKTVTNKYSGRKTSSSSPTSSVARTHSIELTYINNVVYIRYNNTYIKIGGDNIKQIVATVMELLDIETNADMDIDISKIINYSFDLSMLRTEMIKSWAFKPNYFNILADLTSFNIPNSTFGNVNLEVRYDDNGLRNLVIQNFALDNISVSKVDISLMNFTPFGGAPSGNYIDLSSVGDLLQAVNNMKNYTDFEVEGSVNLKINVIGIKLDWNVPINVKVKLLEGNKYEASAVIGEIPVVAGVNDDVPYKFGNTINIKNASPGKNRMLYFYIKDDMAYIYRKETIPVFIGNDKTYEKKLKVHMDTVLNNPLYYLLQFGFGFSQNIMDAIYNSLNREKNPIDYSNVLKGFSASNGYYALTLNLRELSQDDKLDLMTLGIRTSNYGENTIMTGITVSMNMPVASGVEIDLNSNNLNFKNIGGKANMSSLYSFVNANNSLKEGVEWGAYNGSWQETSKTEFEMQFTTNCSQSVTPIKGLAGTQITLPTLQDYYVDTSEGRTYHTFAGWYTSKDCEDGTEYNDNIIPRRDTMLYAKWNTRFVPNRRVTFVTEFGKADDIVKLDGEKATLPTINNGYLDTDTTRDYYTFEGWYTTPTFEEKGSSEIVLTSDTTLYAKWSVYVRKYTTITFVSSIGEQKSPIAHVLEGESIVLPTYPEDIYVEGELECTTNHFVGWFVDKDYLISFTSDIMPNVDTTLYAKWEVVSRTRRFNLSICDGDQLLGENLEFENEKPTIFVTLLKDEPKCNDTTKYYKENTFKTEVDIKTFTMPSEPTTLYVRNRYSVTIISEYGNKEGNGTKYLYQGEEIELKSQSNGGYDTYVNGVQNKRYDYAFNGYYNATTGKKIEGLTYAMPNENTTIKADWTVTVRNYYTLTFSKENSTKNVGFKKYIWFPVEKLVVLEGEKVNLNEYTPIWEYKCGYWYYYNFKGWSTSMKGSKIDYITIYSNTTVYALWKYGGILK